MPLIHYYTKTIIKSLLVFALLGFSSCSYLKVNCKSGLVLVPRNNPKKNYPNYVKSGSTTVAATLKLLKTLDTSSFKVETKRNVTLLRDTLTGWQYLIDRTLFEAKKLSDQNPCDEGLKGRYLTMLENVQKKVLELDPKLEELKKLKNSVNFGQMDENKLNSIITSILEKRQ